MPVSRSSQSSPAASTGRPASSQVPRPTMRTGALRAIASPTISRTSAVLPGRRGGDEGAVPLTTTVNWYHLARVRPARRIEDLSQAAHRGERLLGEDQVH